jgi:hypothetical protein
MFLASQKYKALENNARSNTHFFATYWDSSIAIRRAIWQEQFSSCFENYEDFDTTFKAVCCPPKLPGENFVRPRCLIIDKRNSSSNPNECCFYFEPKFTLPEFSVGSREYLLMGWYASKFFGSRQEDIAREIQDEVQQVMAQFGDSRDAGGEMHQPKQVAREKVRRQTTAKKPKLSVTMVEQMPRHSVHRK